MIRGTGSSRGLLFQGTPAWLTDDYPTARTLFVRARDLADQAGDAAGVAAAEQALAVVAWSSGDEELAHTHLHAGLNTLRTAADNPAAVFTVLTLGGTALWPREDATLRLVFEDTFASYQQVNPSSAIGYVLANLGHLARAAGRTGDAAALLADSLDAARTAGDQIGEAHVLTRLGNLCAVVGQHDTAREHLTCSLQMRNRQRDARGSGLTLAGLGRLATIEGHHDEAHQLFGQARTMFHDTADLPALAGVLADLGEAHRLQHQYDQAQAQALIVTRRIGHATRTAWALLDLAYLARDNESTPLDELVNEAIAIFRRIGDTHGIAHCQQTYPSSGHRPRSPTNTGDVGLLRRGWRVMITAVPRGMPHRDQ